MKISEEFSPFFILEKGHVSIPSFLSLSFFLFWERSQAELYRLHTEKENVLIIPSSNGRLSSAKETGLLDSRGYLDSHTCHSAQVIRKPLPLPLPY